MARGGENHPSESRVRYRLLRETRRGGMSQIWEAIDTQTGRRVAVKRLSVPPTLTPTERRAWIAQIEHTEREIARLQHPNIAAIYDVGQDQMQPFLVMDLLPGRTLRQRLREGPLMPNEAARTLAQAAAALDAAHEIGLVHGGLKPASFLLLPNGMVKLTDFGIARQGDMPTAETMVGSPSYLSPEQIQGAVLGPASDVWAMGVILYEMLAGHPPFSGSRLEMLFQQITAGQPPPAPGMPSAIQAVLSRALAKDPSERYEQAGELTAAFQAALAPALPSAPTFSRRPVRPVLDASTAAVQTVPPKPGRSNRRILFALAGAAFLTLLFLALRVYSPPAAPAPQSVPPLPTEAVLPVPQAPPGPPADDSSPFTPVPIQPVVLEPPRSAKKRHEDAKPKG